jgi:hypothetical protein
VPIFELTKDALLPVATTTFAAEHIRERFDLQRLLRDNIEALAPEVLVLAEEYGDWADAKRRIDLLCLDQLGNLVVVELKRSEDGGHMELQAIRYAAMVSKLTFPQAVEAHARYLGGAEKEEEARDRILKFLDWDTPNEKAFAQDVRIILVSAEFSKEITTSVLWLNERDLDIRCVKLRPYTLGDRILLDIQQVLPLPEAEDYQVQIRRKAAEERLSESGADWTRYDVMIDDQLFPRQYKRGLFLLVISALIKHGITPEQIMEAIPRRLFLVVEGNCDSREQFEEKAANMRTPNGSSYDLGRFFIDSDQLFRIGGKTYALSNQWSKKEVPGLEKLIAQYHQASISFAKSQQD